MELLNYRRDGTTFLGATSRVTVDLGDTTIMAQLGTSVVAFSGGEPMLQVDEKLVEALHRTGFEVAIETNGTLPVPHSIDWICVSPKAGADLVQRSGDELKLVYPQSEIEPAALEHLDFAHFLLQPMDQGALKTVDNVRAAIDYCLAHPKWRLSLQTHKLLGLR